MRNDGTGSKTEQQTRTMTTREREKDRDCEQHRGLGNLEREVSEALQREGG